MGSPSRPVAWSSGSGMARRVCGTWWPTTASDPSTKVLALVRVRRVRVRVRESASAPTSPPAEMKTPLAAPRGGSPWSARRCARGGHALRPVALRAGAVPMTKERAGREAIEDRLMRVAVRSEAGP